MSVPAPKPSVSREWALDIVRTSTNDKNLDLEGPAQAMVIELANLFADDVIRGAYGASIARGSTTGISKEDLEAFLATAWSDLVIPGDLPSRAPARPPTIQQKEGTAAALAARTAAARK